MADRIAEIEARLQAAAPGPWEEFRGGVRIPGVALMEWTNPDHDDPETATLIAHAPGDLRYLLDELAKARAALAPPLHTVNYEGWASSIAASAGIHDEAVRRLIARNLRRAHEHGAKGWPADGGDRG